MPTYVSRFRTEEGGELQIGSGSATDMKAPWYGLYDFGVQYWVYLQSEVGAAKTISAIEFELTGYATPYPLDDITVKLAHTSSSSIPSNTKTDLTNMPHSDLTTCLSGYDLTISSNGWVRLDFTTPFTYNGSDNLLIVVENHDGTWDSGYGSAEGTDLGEYRWFYKYQDTTFPTSEFGTRDDTHLPNLKIHYT